MTETDEENEDDDELADQSSATVFLVTRYRPTGTPGLAHMSKLSVHNSAMLLNYFNDCI